MNTHHKEANKMTENKIIQVIKSLVRQKPILQDIADDEEFFDFGASSLTIVDLQIQVEKELGIEVDSSKLMATPTINGWVTAYSDRVAGTAKC